MGFYEVYLNVFTQIESLLSSLNSLKTVLVGKAFRLTELPMALVSPRETNIRPSVLEGVNEYNINFDVVVFIRETEPEDWFVDIVKPLSEVHDLFLQNPTLNGAAADLKVTLFSPGEITAQNRLYYGGIVRATARLFYPAP